MSKIIPIKYLFLAIPVIFVFFALLIIQLNSYTREYYTVKACEDKISQLNQENKILGIDLSEADSLKNLNYYVQNQTFEKTDKVQYVRVLESTALAK